MWERGRSLRSWAGRTPLRRVSFPSRSHQSGPWSTCLSIYTRNRFRDLLGAGPRAQPRPPDPWTWVRPRPRPEGLPSAERSRRGHNPGRSGPKQRDRAGGGVAHPSPSAVYRSPERGRDPPQVTRHTGPPDPGVREWCETDVQRHMTPTCGDAQTRSRRRTPPSHVSRVARTRPQGVLGTQRWSPPALPRASRRGGRGPRRRGSRAGAWGLAWAVSPRRGTALGAGSLELGPVHMRGDEAEE